MSRKRRRRERRGPEPIVERAPRGGGPGGRGPWERSDDGTDAGPSHRAERHLGRKALARQRVELAARLLRLRRTRTIVGALGFAPLILSLLCGFGAEAFCVVPREIYLAVWAGLFGTFIGLTIRMWIERRRFARATQPA